MSKTLSDRMAESTSDRAYLYAGEVCDLEAELEAVKAERDALLWRVRNEAEGQARIDAEVSK